MKRKIVGLALLLGLIISVTSGCVVREDYGYHHRHWYRDHDDRYHDHDDYRYHRDYDDR
ncbi:MAG: hypothetical protein JSU01_20255 [Bacteroidetes bacterium]|nr:hypothetical protein [Bacteroidota bacterium]